MKRGAKYGYHNPPRRKKEQRSYPRGEENVIVCPFRKVLKSGVRAEHAVWAMDEHGRTFTTCYYCGEVQDITGRRITIEGYVGTLNINQCITCVSCGEHTWVRLEGWNGKHARKHGRRKAQGRT